MVIKRFLLRHLNVQYVYITQNIGSMSFTRTNQDLASASVIMMSFILDTCKIKGYDTCVLKNHPLKM